MAAKSGGRAGELSAVEAAAVLRITPQSLSAWTNRADAPCRKMGTRVWVRDPEFFRWREGELKRDAKESASPGDFDTAKTRKMAAEAELAEIEVAKARADVVLVADYESALARVLDRLAARLRSLPIRLSHLGAAVEEATEAECERIVIELNAWDEDVLDEPAEEVAA